MHLEFSVMFIFIELVHIFIQGPADAHLRVRDIFLASVEDPLVAFGCCLLFGRVVVSLTYSPFPFSILLQSFVNVSFC